MSSLTVITQRNDLGRHIVETRQKVEAAVAWSTLELEAETKRNIVAMDFIESGDTFNSVLGTPDGLNGEVTVSTEQAVYGNYGTRHMAARPFASQAAETVRPKFAEKVAEAMK